MNFALMRVHTLQSPCNRAVALKCQNWSRTGFRCLAVARAQARRSEPGKDRPKRNTASSATSDKNTQGDVGWDPLKLMQKNKPVYDRVREIEIIHARWAMIGVLALIFSDVTGHPVWPPTALSVDTVLPWTLAAGVVLGILETYRLAALWEEQDFNKRVYPGKQFDVLGFTKPKKDEPPGLGVFAGWVGGFAGWFAGGWWFGQRDMTEQGLQQMKARELRNGRLAMVSFLGCCVASVLTGKGPYTLLLEHIADPLHNTIVQTMQH